MECDSNSAFASTVRREDTTRLDEDGREGGESKNERGPRVCKVREEDAVGDEESDFERARRGRTAYSRWWIFIAKVQ